jgi:hypothetical protein
MNYLDTLLFISKCLTINDDNKNRIEVELFLKKQIINWDSIIKVSSNQYVFPALYCNLLRAELLSYLPKDLVLYMEYITDLNRERNEHIYKQVREINSLLLKNNIKPIFLKGASFLVENLYSDSAERIIGDIDFIVSKKDYKKTIRVIKEDNYDFFHHKSFVCLPSKHYPRMVKNGSIASIEIHDKIILNKNSKQYNYSSFSEGKRIIDGIAIPSSENQILQNCINKQFSDKGRFYKSIALRNSYDLYKLSHKTNPLSIIKKDGIYLEEFNTYLGVSNFLFLSKNLEYNKSKQTERKIKIILFLSKHLFFNKLNKTFFDSFFYLKERLLVIVRAVYKKEDRDFIRHKIFNK